MALIEEKIRKDEEEQKTPGKQTTMQLKPPRASGVQMCLKSWLCSGWARREWEWDGEREKERVIMQREISRISLENRVCIMFDGADLWMTESWVAFKGNSIVNISCVLHALFVECLLVYPQAEPSMMFELKYKTRHIVIDRNRLETNFRITWTLDFLHNYASEHICLKSFSLILLLLLLLFLS